MQIAANRSSGDSPADDHRNCTSAPHTHRNDFRAARSKFGNQVLGLPAPDVDPQKRGVAVAPLDELTTQQREIVISQATA